MPGWVFLVLLFVFLIVVMAICGHAQTRRLAAARVGESFDTLRTAVAADELTEGMLRAVYEVFQEFSCVPDFPVRADDSIADIYGLADDGELEFVVSMILAACEREFPPDEQLRQMAPALVTVRDLVRFVAACPATTSRSRSSG